MHPMVNEYLNSIGWMTRPEEIASVVEAFIRDMRAGLAGSPEATMPMLPAYIPIGQSLTEERKVIVMDAGGTNLRVSVVHIQPGKAAEVLYFQKQPMPGSQKPLSKAEFFDQLAQAVEPVAGECDAIGFCFSFPCKIRQDLDGEILYLDKEIVVHDIEGALVGKELLAALEKRGAKHDHHVVILNDTVATLLGALVEHPVECYSGFIGMILGTGMNTCYSEKNSRILKDSFLCARDGNSIVNMEAGAFRAFPRTKADELADRTAKMSGSHQLEKMISGAYQGKVTQALLQCAAEDGVLSPGFGDRLAALSKEISSSDLSAFLMEPTKAGVIRSLADSDEELARMFALADAVVERAALLVTANLTAIMKATETGSDPLRPVCIAVEGTTYMKNIYWRQRIYAHLIQDVQRQNHLYARMVSMTDANLVGSAVAAALNG